MSSACVRKGDARMPRPRAAMRATTSLAFRDGAGQHGARRFRVAGAPKTMTLSHDLAQHPGHDTSAEFHRKMGAERSDAGDKFVLSASVLPMDPVLEVGSRSRAPASSPPKSRKRELSRTHTHTEGLSAPLGASGRWIRPWTHRQSSHDRRVCRQQAHSYGIHKTWPGGHREPRGQMDSSRWSVLRRSRLRVEPDQTENTDHITISSNWFPARFLVRALHDRCSWLGWCAGQDSQRGLWFPVTVMGAGKRRGHRFVARQPLSCSQCRPPEERERDVALEQCQEAEERSRSVGAEVRAHEYGPRGRGRRFHMPPFRIVVGADEATSCILSGRVTAT